MEIDPRELTPGMMIVGSAGETTTVYDCGESTAMPGFHWIECQFGIIYWDSDLPITVD